MSLPDGFGGTTVIAKNGKLVYGSTASCVYHDVFFNTTTDAEWTDHTSSYAARWDRWSMFRDAVPAVIGFPAGVLVRWHPDDR